MAESIDAELQTLKADFSALNRAVADLTRDMKSLLAATAGEGQGRVRAGMEGTLRGMREKAGEMQDWSQQCVEETERRIGEHPLTSLLTAFGIGFVLAKLMDIGSRR